jgi:hypothetical protein
MKNIFSKSAILLGTFSACSGLAFQNSSTKLGHRVVIIPNAAPGTIAQRDIFILADGSGTETSTYAPSSSGSVSEVRTCVTAGHLGAGLDRVANFAKNYSPVTLVSDPDNILTGPNNTSVETYSIFNQNAESIFAKVDKNVDYLPGGRCTREALFTAELFYLVTLLGPCPL